MSQFSWFLESSIQKSLLIKPVFEPWSHNCQISDNSSRDLWTNFLSYHSPAAQCALTTFSTIKIAFSDIYFIIAKTISNKGIGYFIPIDIANARAIGAMFCIQARSTTISSVKVTFSIICFIIAPTIWNKCFIETTFRNRKTFIEKLNIKS